MKQLVKYIEIFFLVIFLCGLQLHAQVWDTLSTGVYTSFKDLQFTATDTCYAVGSEGGIVKTTDNGKTWVIQQTYINNTLRGVYFITSKYGFAVGDSGRIVRTTDGGQTWFLRPSGTTANLMDVSFYSAKFGIIVGGGKILLTNDSGNTRQNIGVLGLGSIVLRSVKFTSDKMIWACGDPKVGATGVLYRSLDSGKTWTYFNNTMAPASRSFNKVLFTNAANGWLFGQGGVIVHTTDSGATNWGMQSSGTSFDFLGADYINGVIYAVGRSGLIVSSNNNGSTWSGQFSSTSRQLWGVDFINDTIGLACGDSGIILSFKKIIQTKPLMLLQPNGGEVWLTGNKYNIIWYGPGIATVILDYSTNNGQNWTSIANGVNANSGGYSWTLPLNLSTTCLIRIRNSSNSAIGDSSDANFIIINPPVGRDYTVLLNAAVNASPPAITINWIQDINAGSYQMYKKLKQDSTWTFVSAFAGNVNSYVDNAVNKGIAYEYKMTKSTPVLTGFGYLCAGIEIAAAETRGAVLVIIDSAFSGSLNTELRRFELDLIADGWMVYRKVFLATVKDSVIKNNIKQTYISLNGNLRSVILIGNIPVPYTGNFAPDGHPERIGAQPSDAYYADIDGNWTDQITQTTNTGPIYSSNTPGDGRWDQSTIPSAVELQVGRIDMHNLPLFAVTETQLLKRYLDKDHAYRYKNFTADARGLLYTQSDKGIANMSAGGWRSLAPMFGNTNLSDIKSCTSSSLCTDLIDSLRTRSYLWTYAGSGGSDTSFGNTAFTSSYCANDSLKSVFMQIWGSYFIEWNKGSSYLKDNLWRATIAAKGYTLGTVWAARMPFWYFHPMALGETIGSCLMMNQNNTKGLYDAGVPSYLASAYMSLMGDPTLRMYVIAPPSSLGLQNAAGTIAISWAASPDAGAGYYVYRSNSINGIFNRLGNAVQANSFIDSFPLTGNNVYIVKAIRLEQNPSGTYYNLSQGIFDSLVYSPSNPVYTIIASSGAGGSINPSGTISVPQNGSQAFTFISNPSYQIDSVFIDGLFAGKNPGYTFTNVLTAHTIHVKFKRIIHTIMATAGTGGSITPAGNIQVNQSDSITFLINPDVNMQIDSVWIDHVYVGNTGTFTFHNVVASHSIFATFKQNTGIDKINCGEEVRVSIYPNPAKRTVVCKWDNPELNTNYRMEISNSTGQIVFQTIINSTTDKIEIDISASIYLINIYREQDGKKVYAGTHVFY